MGGDDTAGSVPVTVPLIQTSYFAFPTFRALVEGLTAEHRHHVYSRGRNPTVEAAERKLAALERGEACVCLGSGMAAISAVFLGLLEAGDHVLFVNHVYGPTLELAAHLRRFGIEHDVVLDGSADAVEAALRPRTRLVWLESPGTMLFRVVDVAAIAEAARTRGALTCMDNSWSTPLFQKPLQAGADIVVHSASKYLAGHSDVVAGAVISRAELLERIFHRSLMLNGGVLGPFDAWLLLRGLRTLPVRMVRHEEDAIRVARFLEGHPAVARVHHPGMVGRGGTARDAPPGDLRGWSGLFSFELRRATFDAVATVIDALERFRIGVSWGGVESQVLSPEREDGAGLAARGLPHGLIRLSIGLEGADPLIEDLGRALGRLL
ncbi:MAG: aminotransferase class V-fold PLP-dependent enzyme [Gemmatimonadetes bacterium]|nr:aminotransferase class I/II-fold pyridoxal phosphate-dependent enzyme [Gemmatimonadota bacterium]NIQ58414.1 aminotransferase class I/II-fold pyridoxal phosphate-dependent enzyme [Gemmatimonadota bacterium]NIU78625.1 aminotransferase class V-fold PLP-dependent enzyme [Gammaproteobacteria bacterium]NIX47468.1 aminotransferase class V-fold PLP-dependent enzyme [Gemmatimonadota bacterium]NIY11851.1 aminotransferase class V-fold PLP-dependent enzyme [Gemmatimonadota bacterium]